METLMFSASSNVQNSGEIMLMQGSTTTLVSTSSPGNTFSLHVR